MRPASQHRLSFAALFLLLLAPTAEAQTASATAPANSQDAQIVHLLNRITYGPTPGAIAAVRQMGMDAYIEQQLHPQNLQMPTELQTRLAALTDLEQPLTSLAEAYEPSEPKKDMSEEEKKEFRKRENQIVLQLSENKILRAAASPAQLQEVMTDFWFNHFNVFAEKEADRIFIGTYERDAIRPYALGRFRDLLQATAHHPAMLVYLDNWLNTDPNSVAARGKKIGINENYAREVMELHTLGVNGGYSQADVTTLAHILTGWGLSEGKSLADKSNFYFEPRRHDFNNQVFLGMAVRGGGIEEPTSVLDYLAESPATARHIAYQLAQYFVADDPPQSLVDSLAATFRSSGGDIAATLRALFHAPEFWDARYAQNKFKPPFRYVVSVLRANNLMPPGDTKFLQGSMAQMGEPLYRCQTPNGYANTNDQWLNSDALLKRIDFAKRVSDLLTPAAAATVQGALGDTWSANTLATAQKAEPKMQGALLLGSPEFVYY